MKEKRWVGYVARRGGQERYIAGFGWEKLGK
jgi:hypothetical protein